MTGLPDGAISGIALPRPRRRRLIAIGAAVALALALSAFAGISTALRAGDTTSGAAPFPHFTLAAPFPSPTVSGALPAMNAMARPSAIPATPAATTAPSSPAPAAVTVTYHVISRWYGGFEGKVTVVGAGYSTVPDGQIVVVLWHDHIATFSGNATGYVTHDDHVLLAYPATDADSVPADGTVSVVFTAYGTPRTPELCAFNDVLCG